MPYSYNPLIVAKLDKNKKDLNDLEDVNTSGTVNGKVLTYQSGTWVPETPAGGGDMLKAEYVSGQGTVYNASRLAGDTLATVQAHTVDAMNILGTIADANIPDVETLSYAVPFADAQIPTLDATKIISGSFNADQIPDLPTSRIATGTFAADRIPTMENLKGTVPDGKIPDVESLSYGGTFAAAQIPNLAASKTTIGTFGLARIPAVPASRITTGTFNLARIPAVDDARIPNLETLSYGGAFATAQIPSLAASKITSGSFNANRIPNLPTSKITSGTLGLARIPAVDDARIPNLETLSYGGAFAVGQIPSLPTSKITSGTLSVARQETLDNLNGTVALNQVPTMDDDHIPNLDTLSYSGAFAAGQIPNLPTSKITSGTLGLARIPSITNAYLAGEITSDKISALSGTAVTYPLNADTVGTTAIKAAGVGNAELAASGLDIAKFTVGTAGLARIPSLPTARITSGTFNLNRIPAVDDARIPNVETLSYGGAFVVGQIPNLSASKVTTGTFNANRIPDLPASKTTSGTFNADRIPVLPTSRITSGTFNLNRIPSVDDARIPNVETLSYGGAFAGAQIPSLAASKITSGTFTLARIPTMDDDHIPNLAASKITTGTFNANRISVLPTSRITTGTFNLARIPAVDDARIPNVETLSYGGAFATAQVPGVGAYKIASGTLSVARQETLDNLNGTVALNQVPTMDDDHIPNLDTLSYSGAFAAGQIPSLPTSKITSGTLGLARIPSVDDARIPNLETLSYGAAFATAQIPGIGVYKITSGTFGLARIPGTLTGKDADTVDGADAGVSANKVFEIPAGIAQGDVFHVNAGGSVVNLSAGTSGHFLKTLGAGTNPGWASVPGGGDMLKNVYDTTDNSIVDNSERLENNTLATVQAHNVAASKVTSGTLGLARIPAVDDARIPNLETLSYGGAFATAQIPSLPTSKITSGTLGLARIPAVDDARIPNLETLSYGGAFAVGQIPSLPTSKITSGTLSVARQETLDNLNGTVALNQVPTMDDDHIPNLDTLSYSGAFAAGQIPNLPTSKITSGTLGLARIPSVDDARIPNLETLSYGGAFATAQIPAVGAYKIITGTFNANRIPILPTNRYGSAVLRDASRTLTADWDIGDGRMIQADKIRARDGAGLALYEDGGKGVFIKDGGNVGISTSSPREKLEVSGGVIVDETLGWSQRPGNIYPDAGFEYGGQHVIFTETYAVITDSAGAHTGNKYLRATGNSVTQDIYNAEYYQVQPGDVFYVEAWIKADAGTDGTAYAVLFEWRDKDKANPGWSSVGSTSNPGTSWVKKSGTVTVPSGKYYMRFGHSVRSDSTTGNWYWDDVYLYKVDKPGPLYVDGNVGIGTTNPSAKLDVNGDAKLGGTLNMDSHKIINVTDPTAAQHAASKAYVDAQTAVKFHPYIGDETQFETVSATYQDIKNFHFVKHGSVVSPGTIRVACELKTTAGSYQMQIIVGSGTALTFSGTESAYKLRYGDYGLGAAATGVVEVRAKLRNIGAGTTYNQLYDAYLKY